MILNHEREKLLNAIIYFSNHTSFLGKVKLCKLLYFLDFEHFKETGRSVTGLNYFAWKMGPVPVELINEVEEPKPDLAKKIRFTKTTIGDGYKLNVDALVEFDQAHFSKREMAILVRLAKDFDKTKADDMVEATHLENLPWHKIYNEMGLKQQLIPYDLAVRKQEETELRKIVEERSALINHFCAQ